MGLKEFFEARSAIRSLSRIADALEVQNQLIRDFAQKAFPDAPQASQQDLLPVGGTFTQDAEQARILDFIDRSLQNGGREPTEDEIVDFLDGRVS